MASNEPSTLVKVDGHSDEESKTYNGVRFTAVGFCSMISNVCTPDNLHELFQHDVGPMKPKKFK